jgi:hypothetical protein
MTQSAGSVDPALFVVVWLVGFAGYRGARIVSAPAPSWLVAKLTVGNSRKWEALTVNHSLIESGSLSLALQRYSAASETMGLLTLALPVYFPKEIPGVTELSFRR